MSKLAFIFPGQASQYPGMGRDLYDNFPESRAVFDEADAALGFPISKICFEGSEDDLKLTENTQPAILTVSVAAYRALEKRGIVPDFAAGHSLGEYSALVAAGAMTFSDSVKLARRRGGYMQAAVARGRRRNGRDSGAFAVRRCGSLQKSCGSGNCFPSITVFTGAVGYFWSRIRR